MWPSNYSKSPPSKNSKHSSKNPNFIPSLLQYFPNVGRTSLVTQKRIEYKLLLITFKATHNLAPQYISDMLHPYPTPRPLRSSDENLLAIPQSRTKSYGDRAFSIAAPKLWNGLPDELRFINELGQFKRQLKTHLFKSAYNCDK